MGTATLDDFMALNDEIAALARAGIPLDVDLALPGTDPAGALERINAVVARRVSQGASLAEAVAGDEQALSPSYRSLVLLGLASGNLHTALDESHRLARSVEDSWHVLARSIVYPVIVCCIAYVGMIGFCLFFVPVLENLYHSMRIPPGIGLTALQWLRTTLPYWIAIPPLLLVLWLAWWMLRKSRPAFSVSRVADVLAWLPGISRAVFQQRCANFSETLSRLLASGMPLPEGLRLAADACGDATLTMGARALATSLDQGQIVGDDSPAAMRFPPFLRWVLWHSEPITGRPRSLKMAAWIYGASANHFAERLRVIAPIVACIILGGGVTLLYGLALFVPVVEMLRGMAA